jgi:hypothetical protein
MKKNERLGKIIPYEIKFRLMERFEIIISKDRKNKWKDIAIEINEYVTNKLKSPLWEFREYFIDEDGMDIGIGKSVEDRYISAKILNGYFKDQNTETRSLMVLAAFVGLPLKDAERIVYNQTTVDISYEEHLRGGWNVYFHDASANEITKMVLWLEPYNYRNYHFRARLMVPWGEPESGMGRIESDDSLTLELNDHYPFVYISAKLPSKTEKSLGSMWILNAGALVNRNAVIIGNLIMVKKVNVFREEDLFAAGKKSVKYKENPVPAEYEDQISESLVNEIIVYLTRHRDNPVGRFQPNTVNQIRERNFRYIKKRARNNYSIIKKQIGKGTSENVKWYSFSRVLTEKQEIAVFEWQFSFNNARQEVIVERIRINRPDLSKYKGEVTLESDHLYVRFRDENNTKRKSFIAAFPREGDKTRLHGISSTLFPGNQGYESSHMAIREILIYLTEMDIESLKLEDGYLSYQDFVDFDRIIKEDKIYLNTRESSTLSFPQPINFRKNYARIIKASEFHGDYYLIAQNKSVKDTLFFLHSFCIDQLGYVVLKVAKENSIISSIYEGTIKYYASNMHCHLETDTYDRDKQHIINLIFDNTVPKYNQSLNFLTGIYLTTSLKRTAISSPFVLIKKSLFLKESESDLVDLEWIRKHTRIAASDLKKILKSILPS